MNLHNYCCAHGTLPYQCTAPECGFRTTANERDQYKRGIIHAARALAAIGRDMGVAESMALELARLIGFEEGPAVLEMWLEQKAKAYSLAAGAKA